MWGCVRLYAGDESTGGIRERETETRGEKAAASAGYVEGI